MFFGNAVPGPGHVYDLIVVGAGTSGCEAASSCADAGLDTLLVTTSLDTVYNLLGDGVTLRPEDGTLLAELCRELAEGGYVRSWDAHRWAKYRLERTPNVHLLQSNISALLLEDGTLHGVSTWEGVDRLAPAVALCVGSFLRARLTMGSLTETAGRLSEMAYDDLYWDLERLGFTFESLRLKARADRGTPPYTVACQRFSAEALDSETFELVKVPGLYAAGLCSRGFLTFEEAAADGQALAAVLLSVVGK